MWKSHAIETARLYNQIHPRNIWVLALKLFPGTQLYRQANQGLFEPMTPWQMLREEWLLVQCLDVYKRQGLWWPWWGEPSSSGCIWKIRWRNLSAREWLFRPRGRC